MNRRIMFLRNENFSPVGCLVISLSKDYKTVRYQLSVLNPVDRFERSLARHIALGRLLEKPIRIRNLRGDENNFEITWHVMNDIAHSMNLPGRARKAARQWLTGNKKFEYND